jgi:hypothetical protein
MNRIALLSFAALASSLAAQSNTVVGLDGRLTNITDLHYWGRRGAAYPGGQVGMSMQNEMCNPGTVQIPWQATMQPNHPKFGFLLCRVVGGRIEQINDWSYVKHAFTSVNGSGPCGTCQSTGGLGGTVMGIHCSDAYGSGNNGDRFYLGPPDEIDPWLGTWNPVGSYFDHGDPNVGGAAATDGVRSLTSTQIAVFDAVKNRMTVNETDLITPGAQYFYGIQLIHQGEAVANRGDNLASRGTTPSWNGTSWSFPDNVDPFQLGSILTRWPGADVQNGQNGNDDGRFFVASKVTPLGGSNYHYEYAVHDVDNNRGAATFRIPIAASATASNFTFRDIDANPLNNWTSARVGNEIVFTAPAGNPLNWDMIFNFGFDATFPPGSGAATLDEARVGPGALSVTVGAKVPSGSTFAQVTSTGNGCGGTNCQQSFYELFSPPTGFDLANTQWALTFNGTNYHVGTGSGTYVAPAGTSLTMSDDTEVSIGIPFSLPYPGGTTNTLWVCSNGFVSPVSNGASYTPSSSSFVAGGACWAALWHDMVPSTGQVLVDSSASVVRVSYTAVPYFGAGGTATFQYQFFPNGNVNVIYQAVAGAGNDMFVGFTPGSSADPGSWNISANLAAGLNLCAAPVPNLALGASGRPVMGTSINLNTTNIPSGSLLGISILSLTQYVPGVDLGPLGMPTCTLYAGLDVLNTFLTPTSSASVPWSVPNVPAANGVLVMNQSAVLKAGINPFGAITSNALQLLVGLN